MALTILQIIAGMLRPDNDGGKKRKIFNWIHRISGVVTLLVAIVTMISGSNIEYMHAEMKVQGTGLLAGLVGVHVLTAIILQIMSSCCSK